MISILDMARYVGGDNNIKQSADIKISNDTKATIDMATENWTVLVFPGKIYNLSKDAQEFRHKSKKKSNLPVRGLAQVCAKHPETHYTLGS
jgi:hypothetical protein